MADSEQAQSISKKSQQVRRSFLDLISCMKEKKHDISPSPAEIIDALERFTLWARNLGAMHSPTAKLSLDHRLSAAHDIRQQICLQLDEVATALEDLMSIVQGISPNRDMAFDMDIEVEDVDEESLEIDGLEDEDATIEPFDEAHMLIEVISESISYLFRIGILVRKSTPRDRFKRALQASDLAFPASFDVDYVRQKHPKIREGSLLGRLGGGIAKRRQFIRYCRDHRNRLGADDLGEEGKLIDARTEHSQSKATTFLPQKVEEVEDDAVSFMSASTATESLSNLKLPLLADLSNNNEAFECPICFTIQSFQTERSWRIHAFRDLKAYLCTVGDEECDARFFGDRDTWFEHELKEHRARYTCSLCGHGPLGPKQIRAHIQTAHGPFSDDQLQMLLDAGREALTKIRAKDCPFCHDWEDALHLRTNPGGKSTLPGEPTQDIFVSTTRFKRHVAVHQEQLAIFALPRATEENGTRESASDGHSHSHVLSVSEDDEAIERGKLSHLDISSLQPEPDTAETRRSLTGRWPEDPATSAVPPEEASGETFQKRVENDRTKNEERLETLRKAEEEREKTHEKGMRAAEETRMRLEAALKLAGIGAKPEATKTAQGQAVEEVVPQESVEGDARVRSETELKAAEGRGERATKGQAEVDSRRDLEADLKPTYEAWKEAEAYAGAKDLPRIYARTAFDDKDKVKKDRDEEAQRQRLRERMAGMPAPSRPNARNAYNFDWPGIPMRDETGRRVNSKEAQRESTPRRTPEKVLTEAARQRLAKRFEPSKQDTVNPEGRRRRVLYDDGTYRWEEPKEDEIDNQRRENTVIMPEPPRANIGRSRASASKRPEEVPIDDYIPVLVRPTERLRRTHDEETRGERKEPTEATDRERLVERFERRPGDVDPWGPGRPVRSQDKSQDPQDQTPAPDEASSQTTYKLSDLPDQLSGDDADESDHPQGNFSRTKKKRPAVYINGQRVLDITRSERSRRERVVIVDGPPPTTRGFDKIRPPPPPPTTLSSNSGMPRNWPDGDDNDRGIASRRARNDDEISRRLEYREEQRQREKRFRARIAEANAVIDSRPAVPRAPTPRRNAEQEEKKVLQGDESARSSSVTTPDLPISRPSAPPPPDYQDYRQRFPSLAPPPPPPRDSDSLRPLHFEMPPPPRPPTPPPRSGPGKPEGENKETE
ncbi:hypothetical protein AUP68_08986 [Ilyonectria robusta]